MSDQNMPDFDSMSPEEMQEWLESLAKRSGATEGFTTAASMEVAEVDPDSVDMDSIGEYIPYGWTKEQWEAQLAKEAAQKAAKQQQQAAQSPVDLPQPPQPAQPPAAAQPPTPASVPEPASVPAPAASTDPTAGVDFDSMTPEQMQEWLESLAKRSGATEGFTTAASMEVAEVDPDSVDMASLGEYIPYGWSKEQWEAQLAKEAAQKAAKQQQQAAQSPVDLPQPPQPAQPPAPASVPEPASVPDAPAASADPTAGVDFDSMTPEQMQEWLESLAKRSGATEGFTTAASMEVAEVDPDSVDMASLGEYIPYGWSKEQWEAQLAKEAAQKAAKQQQQAAQSPVDLPQPPQPAQPPAAAQPPEPEATPLPDMTGLPPAADLDALFGAMGQAVADDMPEMDAVSPPEVPAAQPSAVDDPMAWLQGLAAEDSNDIPAMNFDALGLDDVADPLAGFNLDNLAAPQAGATDADDPMAWLRGLTNEAEAPQPPEQPEAEMPDLSDLLGEPAAEVPTGPSADDDPMEWMETLASRQGADPDELTTDASLDIPEPQAVADDGPGYEAYSFFEDEDDDTRSPAPSSAAPATNVPDPELDPAAWLDELAANSSNHYNGEDEDDYFESEDDFEFDPADLADDPDTERSFAEAARTGQLSPDLVQDYFRQAFQRADARGDIPDYIEPEEPAAQAAQASDEPPVPADIPDWLRDQMQGPPEIAAPLAEADELPTAENDDDLAALFDVAVTDETDVVDDFELVDADEEMPDWLRETADAPQADMGLLEDDAEPELTEADLPAWLLDDDADFDPDAQAEDDLSDIFAQSGMAYDDFETITSTELGVDTSDPWVEAFVLENEKSEEMADWYTTRLEQLSLDAPEAVAEAAEAAEAAETEPEPFDLPAAPAATTSNGLQQANLPEVDDLPAGQPQAVPGWLADEVLAAAEPELDVADMPDWLSDEVEATEVAELADAGDMPAWLMDQVQEDAADSADIPDWLMAESEGTAEPLSEDIPEWLREQIDEGAEAPTEAVAQPAQLAPPPVQPAPLAPAATLQPAGASPAPLSRAAASIDIPQTLSAARSKVQSGQIDAGMTDYEAIVRANAELDTVVADLEQLLADKEQRQNPAVHRVMGDVLMRQGRLQDALDTYRKALQLL